MKTASYWPLVLALATALILSGCGGSSGPAEPNDSMADQSTPPLGKVQPDLEALASGMQSKTLPEALAWNSAPKARTVKGTQCSWFRTLFPTKTRVALITVQQAPSEDSDLYVFNNWPMRPNWKIGQSSRFANTTMSDYTAMGVPDWVTCVLTKTTGAAYVMVYGESEATKTNHFTIENDLVLSLSKTGALARSSVVYRDSRWWRFTATSGKKHTVTLTAPAGSNPDMVVYDTSSAGYKGSNYTANGGGTISFTPTNKRMHYVRVFGNAVGTTSSFTLKLTVAP